MNRPRFLLLFVVFFLSLPALSAQTLADQVKAALQSALTQHVRELFPTTDCQHNASAHTYKGEFSITRTQEVGTTLRIYGRAKVAYRSRYEAGDGFVDFYAECIRHNGQVEVTRLRWRKDDCMRYESLFGG